MAVPSLLSRTEGVSAMVRVAHSCAPEVRALEVGEMLYMNSHYIYFIGNYKNRYVTIGRIVIVVIPIPVTYRQRVEN